MSDGTSVRCPRCKADNRTGRRFCARCGGALPLPCAACGFSNEPGDEFCGGCAAPLIAVPASAWETAPAPEAPVGAVSALDSPRAYTPAHLAERILTSKSALEGERKLVTVLFVDVSGFTALSERLDPEDVHGLMDRAFELMLAEIHRYEGTVNQFLGDGLMALFGAPVAHEDHAVRALHAALGIRRALEDFRDRLAAERGIDFRVRMGLNTGPVVVGKIGDNLRMDYTAVGDTTNLAARLLTHADPGQVLVGDDTARAADRYFVLTPLAPLAVKGKTQPVRAHALEGSRGVHGRIDALLERGLTPLVGRDRELAVLADRFADVQAGRGQVVVVFGEAGIGKSRLLVEFRRAVEKTRARWFVGRCVSYGRGISYLPVLDLVRDLLGIADGDSVETIERAVNARVRDLGTEVAWTAPFIRVLLSVDPGDPDVVAMNPHQRRSRIVDAVRALFHAAGRERPLVLAVEDLHWIDSHSEQVLRLLMEGIATLPVMVLLTHRPGYTPPFDDRTYHSRITLQSLAAEQTAALVDRVLEAADVPAAVRDVIASKTEGNPLFVEELARTLVEDGTLAWENGRYRLARPLEDVQIPDTIQGVIMARIDRLPEAAKTALQTASVIGREFTARLVARVSAMQGESARALGELRAVELIYEKSVHPELAYMFKHALTHDVAYESLLKQRRRALHRRVGEVIEELYPERLREFYETLAWHYVRGEAWPHAVDYLIKAAGKARSHYAYREAIRHCVDAIGILDRQGGAPGVTSSVLELLGSLHSLLGHIDEANQAYDRALATTEDAAARRRIANTRHRRGIVERDGARLAYYEHGSGEPTLVLMHPLFYGLGTYQPFLESLCQEFRIITVDPRGTGGSDPIPPGYLLRDHVEDARAVIEATCQRPVVLVGISRAGGLVLTLAATSPHLVDRVVTVGSSPARFRAGGRRPEVPSLIRERRYEEGLRIMWTNVASEPGTRDLVESFVQSSLELSPAALESFFLVDDPGRDLEASLPTLRLPVLVLHGDEDRNTPIELGHRMAALIPGAQLYVFPGRGHALYATATAEFVEVVRNFVRTGSPTPSREGQE